MLERMFKMKLFGLFAPKSLSKPQNDLLPRVATHLGVSALQEQFDRLQESEQHLRITLMSMGDGLIATDSQARITFLNPSAEELTGWSREQARGKSFLEVFRIYNSITGAPAEDIVHTVLSTGNKVNLANHTVLIGLDGTHRHISDSAAPIRDTQGTVKGVVVIFSDVTERYHLQQQLRISEARSTAALRMAHLGTWEHDIRNNRVIWSPIFRQILGVAEDQIPDNDFWTTLVHHDDLPAALKSREEAWASGDHYHCQYRIHRSSDGALRYIKTYTSIERNEFGSISRMIGVMRDITEEMEAAERIRESEELYRSTFEQAVIGMMHIGLEGQILRVNRSICEIAMYSDEELLSRNVHDFIHPDDAEQSQKNLRILIQEQNTSREIIRRFFRGDGEVVLLSISASVMLDSKGIPQYIIASVQDVTARQKAQAALAKSEQRLRRAQELSHTGNWEINLAKKHMWASDEAFRIYGYEICEYNTLPLSVPQSAVIPEYRPKLNDALERLLKYNDPYDLEFSIHRPDGSSRIIHSIAVAERDEAGQPMTVTGVLQDITDQRRIEEEYGKALSTTLDGFWMADKDLRIAMVNDAICSMLGYSRAELIGMPVNYIVVQTDTETRDRRRRVISAGAERFEALLRRKDKTIFDVEISLSYIPSSDSTCAFSRDITERKRRETHIKYLSYHDALTGLYNRAFFEEECARMDALSLLPVTVVMGDINGLKLTNDVFGHAQGDKLLRTIANIMQSSARDQDIAARIGGDEFCVLMPYSGPAEAKSLCERIHFECERQVIYLDDGRALPPSVSVGYATRWTMERTFNEVFKEAEDAMYKRKLLERKSMHSTVIASIRITMYEKSRETREHADRLAEMACKLGRLMGLDDSQISELELLCALHDLGKIGVPEHILDKPGPLTDAEWVEMRKHPEIGYRIAQASPELVSVAEGILCHHERWNGTGYPQGLKGTSIPLISRILAVVDSFDAMTSDRVYRKAITYSEALAEIESCAGSQFDPYISALFVRMIKDNAQ